MNKERLREIRRDIEEHESLQAQLAEIESALYSPKNQRFDGMPHSGSKDNALEKLAEKHIALQERYNEQINLILGEMLSVEEAIRDLEPRERMVIRYRYLNDLSWEQIAERMCYEISWIHRIHGRALYKLENKQ